MKVYGVLFVDENNKTQTDKVYVPALSAGAAVEVSLAFHGMLNYQKAMVSESNKNPTPGYELSEIMPYYKLVYLNQDWANLLDTHHAPNVELVADNWKESLP